MPSSVGPNTFGEENLVFGYDLGDVRNSYKGEPTVNYVPGTYGYSLYAYASGPVDTTVLNENNKSITAKRYTITNAVNTARAAIFPNGLTTGVAYTFSFKWKYNGTTTASPSIGVDASKGNPEGGANNNGFTSTTSSTVSIGNGWYLTTYTFVFSSNPTGACMLTFGIGTGSNTSYIGETFDIYEAQFEIKDHRTQYSNGTRSATQGLLDLTGNSTIDLTNVSFDSNAQMTFDGTDDIIQIPSATWNILQTFTLEAVFKANGTAGSGYHVLFQKEGGFSGGAVYGLRANNAGGNLLAMVCYDAESASQNFLGSSTLVTNGKYYHVLSTFDSSYNWKLYINGVLENSSTLTAVPFQNTSPIFIGRGDGRTMNGDLPISKIYNRALTASEVQSNYRAVKNRFNI
jgi:hypothetical protein